MSTGLAAGAVSISYPRLRLALAACLLAIASALVPGGVQADEPTSPGHSGHAEYSQRVETMIAAARAYLGTPYRVGT